MNMGRPREFDTEQALEQAMHQFWSVGYEATSIEDLLKTMHLSKSSFYQTFGSKSDLFLNCINIYQQSMVDELNDQLNNSNSSKTFVKCLLDDVISEATSKHKKGCLLVNTINELSQRDKVVSKAVSAALNNVTGVMRKAIERGKKEGEINSATNTKTLVSYLIANISGLHTIVKSGADKSELKSVVNMIINNLY
jgi:TetR/AcrR family transcriptional repressor of nem operon